METIMQINGVVNNFVWGPPGLTLLVGTGIYLTFLLGMPQIRYFFPAIAEVFSFREKSEEDKSISSFAAMVTAMAATVGTGNVAGVATALHLAGPGALVWMLISAFFGMCTKFAEVTLAVYYRKRDSQGDWRGGPMYILEYGLGEWGGLWKHIGKLLAMLFALLTFLASFGIGAAVQANSAAEALFMGWNLDHLYSGVTLAVLVGLVIIGGFANLSRVTMLVVPFMIVFYMVSVGIIFLSCSAQIPAIIAEAFRMAFCGPDSSVIAGGVAGWAVMEAVQRGIARGVFSNEAGMGSAPMAHATADNANPVQQGLYGIFEVFLDTFVICTITGIVILVTGTMAYAPDLTGAQLALLAFELALGTEGKYILALCLMLFAFTTILGWYWYAETAMTYLFGVRFKAILKLLLLAMIFIGASGAQLFDASGNEFMNNIWNISDTLNGLIAVPNLIGLLLLSFTLRRLVKDYDAQREACTVENVPAAAEKKPMSGELRQLLIVSVCAALLPIAIVTFGSGPQDTVRQQDVSLQRVLDKGSLIFGFDVDFPPMSFIDENREFVGFDVDLGREICSRLGVGFVARPIVWGNKEKELDEEMIDCIGGMSVITEPGIELSMSEPYIKENLVFVIRGDSSVVWMSDLKGKKVGMQAGSTTQDALYSSDIRKDITVVPLDDNMAVLRQVQAGKLDAGLVDSLTACYFIGSSSERYFVLSDSLREEDLAIGFRKEDRGLRDKVQKIIRDMKADGTLGRISKKWFGSDVTIVR
ncbi:alanine or glycine:cation symporter, AGCS family [Selenomonas ruminantium]|uniref:Alanine or glycine:cation symporter, AGCS family n=1 Tax=Selenomonas ruminantium TaxID=971 RepID=A0A1M6R2J3_SELRU|nr:amino acid carrier protein [Selenomonas ruminantium]SHK26610.1 alanine or glycine:cation symporter, AGCS family [Selenomonas ruminantium]